MRRWIGITCFIFIMSQIREQVTKERSAWHATGDHFAQKQDKALITLLTPLERNQPPGYRAPNRADVRPLRHGLNIMGSIFVAEIAVMGLSVGGPLAPVSAALLGISGGVFLHQARRLAQKPS